MFVNTTSTESVAAKFQQAIASDLVGGRRGCSGAAAAGLRASLIRMSVARNLPKRRIWQPGGIAAYRYAQRLIFLNVIEVVASPVNTVQAIPRVPPTRGRPSNTAASWPSMATETVGLKTVTSTL
jgi:hypothetical protein